MCIPILQASMPSTRIKVGSSVVHECTLVKARPIYGYHAFESLFIKVSVWVSFEISSITLKEFRPILGGLVQLSI